MDRKILLSYFNFWEWLLKDGVKEFKLTLILIDLCVGLFLNFVINKELNLISTSILLPVIALLIAISVSWVGNFYSMLNEPYVQKLIEKNDFKLIVKYINKIQMTMLIMFIFIILWGLVGTGPWDAITRFALWKYMTIPRIALFSYSSLTFREAWQGLRAYHMFVLQKQIIDQVK